MGPIVRLGQAGQITIPQALRYGVEFVEIRRRDDGVIELRPVDPINIPKTLLERIRSRLKTIPSLGPAPSPSPPEANQEIK